MCKNPTGPLLSQRVQRGMVLKVVIDRARPSTMGRASVHARSPLGSAIQYKDTDRSVLDIMIPEGLFRL